MSEFAEDSLKVIGFSSNQTWSWGNLPCPKGVSRKVCIYAFSWLGTSLLCWPGFWHIWLIWARSEYPNCQQWWKSKGDEGELFFQRFFSNLDPMKVCIHFHTAGSTSNTRGYEFDRKQTARYKKISSDKRFQPSYILVSLSGKIDDRPWLLLFLDDPNLNPHCLRR